jgi:hypothetical protein
MKSSLIFLDQSIFKVIGDGLTIYNVSISENPVIDV